MAVHVGATRLPFTIPPSITRPFGGRLPAATSAPAEPSAGEPASEVPPAAPRRVAALPGLVRGAETNVRCIPEERLSMDSAKRCPLKTGVLPAYQSGGSWSIPSNCLVQIPVRLRAMAYGSSFSKSRGLFSGASWNSIFFTSARCMYSARPSRSCSASTPFRVFLGMIGEKARTIRPETAIAAPR